MVNGVIAVATQVDTIIKLKQKKPYHSRNYYNRNRNHCNDHDHNNCKGDNDDHYENDGHDYNHPQDHNERNRTSISILDRGLTAVTMTGCETDGS